MNSTPDQVVQYSVQAIVKQHDILFSLTEENLELRKFKDAAMAHIQKLEAQIAELSSDEEAE